MRKFAVRAVFLVLCSIMLFACGGGGGDVNVNSSPETENPPVTPPVTPPETIIPTVTLSNVSGGMVDITFDSQLMKDHPEAEPDKVIGLMDEVVRIQDVTKVCWRGDKAGWSGEKYCTTNVRTGNNFHFTFNIPEGDTGNFIAYLNPTAKGSESWGNISKWKWPKNTKINDANGVVTLLP